MRDLPAAIAFVTRTGTRAGVLAGGPQALRSGVADAPDGLVEVPGEEPAKEPAELQAATIRTSARRAGDRRRGNIGHSVAKSVGTCRRGRMAAS